jgi:hypothetical protein
MRKTVMEVLPAAVTSEQPLDLVQHTQVWLTSEAVGYPIEAALSAEPVAGWRAAPAGEQVLRFVFDTPVDVQRIQLLFNETEHARTQEFLLRWAPDATQVMRELLRQQYHFSPPGTCQEREDYQLALPGLKVLELSINPGMHDVQAVASLQQLQVWGAPSVVHVLPVLAGGG